MRTSLLLLALLAASILQGQGYRGRLQGVVSDPSNAPVAGASVTLTNTEKGIATQRTSDEAGRYIFDQVEPGRYSVSVEGTGFTRFVQENILVQNRGDITVDVQLKLGGVAEAINVVTESPASVQFNTSTMDMTVDNTMVRNLPVIGRNPFTLTLLDPAVVNRYTTAEKTPFKMWASSQLEVGGPTSQKNDTLLDGMPAQAGPKGTYAPSMDAVTEVSVQQNSVDAEYGHSAGGVLNVAMKSGTNSTHGTTYYFGRNPSLNAASNAITHAPNQVRNHIFGGVIGHPVVKNKLFHFFSYEEWHQREPRSRVMTLPTALEKEGDFSRSRNVDGALRTIYDPATTRLVNGVYSRTPFPDNIIPKAQQDPTSVKFAKEIWAPNLPGDGFALANNFRADFYRANTYRNLSTRVDYAPTDKLRMFGRYSRFRTSLLDKDYTPNGTVIYEDLNSGTMNATNVAGDAVYTLSPTTVLNIRGNIITMEDSYDGSKQKIDPSRLKEFWGTDWWTPYLNPAYRKYFFPGVNVDGSAYGKSNWFLENPTNYYLSAKISKQSGKHFIKTGGEWRFLRPVGGAARGTQFNFGKGLTANTPTAPNTRASGDGYATMLLGGIDEDSNAQVTPTTRPSVHYWGFYVQDDLKLTSRLTLNLGLRYEFEKAPYDRGGEYRLSRPFDRTNPIPEMQATPPVMPDVVRSLMNQPYQFNGAWRFTDQDNPGMWNPKKENFLPRAGLAFRLDSKTAIRAGYARYLTPANVQVAIIGELPYPGFSGRTNVAPVIEGKPQAYWSNPFPSTNPLIPVQGKALGRYTNLGGAVTTDVENFKPNLNDRFNVSLQREVMQKIVLDVTYFANIGHDLPYTKNFNMMDPQLSYTNKTLLTQRVNNPFYQYLTPSKFPGQLRNQAQVTIADLLKPFPQYSSLTQTNTPGVKERYHSVQIKAQRPFANGFNFVLAYNYNRERQQEFYNDLEEFKGVFRYEPAQRPRQRMTVASVYELPFGKNRKYLGNTHKLVDYIVGGWAASGIYSYSSGTLLRFGALEVVGDPHVGNPSKWGLIFDPNAFRQLPAFTVRTNPKTIPGIVGPGFKNLDLTLGKFFNLTERFRLELKMEGYNISNTFNAADPSTTFGNANFGRVSQQAPAFYGREFQYNLKLHF
jgi:hypothetical protein